MVRIVAIAWFPVVAPTALAAEDRDSARFSELESGQAFDQLLAGAGRSAT